MGTVIGYARASTGDQSTEIQSEQLKAAGADKVVREYASGKALKQRQKLLLVLEMLEAGDTLMVTKLDRLGRNTRDMLNIIADLKESNIAFRSLDLGMDTSTPTGQFAMTVLAAAAQMERERIRERQREGIELAKRKGIYKGRQPTFQKHIEPVKHYLAAGKGPKYICETIGISKGTFYKIKAKIEGE